MILVLGCAPSAAATPVSETPPTAAAPPMQALQEPDLVAAAPPLQMRVAVAPELSQRRGWYRDFHCATRRAARLLRETVGRDLRLRDRVPWSGARGSGSLAGLRDQLLRDIEHGGADVVVGILPSPGRRWDDDQLLHERGLVAYAEGYVVLRVAEPLCEVGNLLAHEVAHLFGGVHRPGRGNLMDPSAPGTRVDELNAALFDLHRGRRLGAQPPLGGEMLGMMRRLATADTAAADTWLRVGVLAAMAGDPAAACRHYERALGIEPRLRTAWVNLGHAHLQMEDFAAAAEAYAEALSLDPDDGRVHYNLAVVYLSVDRPMLAQASMNRARELGEEIPAPLREAIRAAAGSG